MGSRKTPQAAYEKSKHLDLQELQQRQRPE